MAFREEAGLNNFRPYEKMSVGEVVAEGWYEGDVRSIFEHDNYLIREGNGQVVEVNYCGHLRHKWEKARILVGDYVKIIYMGSSVLETGKFKGKVSHKVQLLRDPDLCRRPGQKELTQQQQTRGSKFKEQGKDEDQAKVASFAASLAGEDEDMDI
jgi:hypothetical protein